MFQGQDIERLVELLKRREVSLFHACQLQDFKSYLELDGIPSRALLEQRQLAFTEFSTDQQDRINNDWDKVFGNFGDFGNAFAFGGAGVPTVYGPILLEIHPEAFLEAIDVAVCLRSAGKKDFDRSQESLQTIDDMERIFKFSLEDVKKSGNFKQASYLKTRAELMNEFDIENASSPEFSCTVDSGKFSMQYVKLIRVDPYIINGKSLISYVRALVASKNKRIPIYERNSQPFANELISALTASEGIPTLASLVENPNFSQRLRDWAQKVTAREGLERQFNQFGRYLIQGTIQPLIREEI